MTLILDSFWRAVAYCLHPRVIALSFLPLVIMVALSLGLGYFYWEPALDWVRAMLESSAWITRLWGWLEGVGVGNLKTVLAPLIVIFAVTPVIVLLSLLIVACAHDARTGGAGGRAALSQAGAQARRLPGAQHLLVPGFHPAGGHCAGGLAAAVADPAA